MLKGWELLCTYYLFRKSFYGSRTNILNKKKLSSTVGLKTLWIKFFNGETKFMNINKYLSTYKLREAIFFDNNNNKYDDEWWKIAKDREVRYL